MAGRELSGGTLMKRTMLNLPSPIMRPEPLVIGAIMLVLILGMDRGTQAKNVKVYMYDKGR